MNNKLTYSETIDLKILDSLYFLEGQLALHKIAFSENGDNKHIQVMDELNKTIKLIKYLKENTLTLTKRLKG
jgi:hypothetical protein